MAPSSTALMFILTCCQVIFYSIWSWSLLDVWPHLSESVVNVCETEISWEGNANVCTDVLYFSPQHYRSTPHDLTVLWWIFHWHFVEASELFACFFSFNWGSTIVGFFITLNNIVPLILMVIACNSIYFRKEGIKKSIYKRVIWTEKLAEKHVIFSSFSCFHLFIKSFPWMQLLFAHKIRLFLKCHVIYHTHTEEQSEPLITAQSLHPQAAVGRR